MSDIVLTEYRECREVTPAHLAEREAKRLLAHKKAYVRWDKVWEDPTTNRVIYHFKYRCFAYREYPRTKQGFKHVALFTRPTSMTFQITQKKVGNERVIISFKGGKLGVFRVSGKRIRRISPLRLDNGIDNPTLKAIRFRDSQPEEYQGWVRNERRLIKLFIKLARANKVRTPDLSKCPTLISALIDTYYPAYREMRDFGMKVSLPNEAISDIAPHMRKPFKGFLKSLSGHDSKAMTKLFLSSKEPSTLDYRRWITINTLKGLVPLDYLYRVFQTEWVPQFRSTVTRSDGRRFLKHYFPQTIIRWTLEKPNGEYHTPTYLNDMVSMYVAIREYKEDYTPPKSTNMVAVHDELASIHRKLKVEDRPLKHPKPLLALNLEGTRLGDYTLVLPKTIHELLDWGTQMSNCIGGYANQIEHSNSWVLGCRDEQGRIVYGIDLDPRNFLFAKPYLCESICRQFKGKHNVDAPQELKEALIEIFKSAIDKRDSLDHALQILSA